jgi:hypothetical protein
MLRRITFSLLAMAFVIASTPATIKTAVPDWLFTDPQTEAFLGEGADDAGDVNGDGFDDIIVRAARFDNPELDEGKAYLFLGSATGPGPTPAWTFETDQADALITSTEAAGDVNGDGFGDVLVGSGLYDNGETDEGRAWLFLGSASGLSTTPAWIAETNLAGARIGTSVAEAGDVNGDGYDDVFIGAPSWTNPEINEGAALVYYGSAAGLPSSPSFIFEINQARALGGRGGEAGDVNGDGFDDIIVEAFAYDYDSINEGIAFVLYGSATGLQASNQTILELDSPNPFFFANQVAAAGDVNGDGFGDVLVNSVIVHRVYVFYGPLSGAVDNTPDVVLEASGPPQNADALTDTSFGDYVASGGDVNGDGFDDVIIGADSFGNQEQGRAFLYLGSATGLSSTPAQTFDGHQPRGGLGFSAESAGDVNGDGLDDLVIGEAFWNAPLTPDAGRIHLYLASADFP